MKALLIALDAIQVPVTEELQETTTVYICNTPHSITRCSKPAQTMADTKRFRKSPSYIKKKVGKTQSQLIHFY
jgi:hypothetical protein